MGQGTDRYIENNIYCPVAVSTGFSIKYGFSVGWSFKLFDMNEITSN